MPDANLPERRHCFVVETEPASDALIRVLTPFAVQAAELTGVVLTHADGGLSIRIEADGLDPPRADRLRRQLGGLPIVRSVGLGWRAAAMGS